MRIYIILTMLIAAFCTITTAQDRIPVELQKWQFNVNILDPGITFESGLSQNQSFVIGGGITTSFNEDDASINPVVHGTFRNYYPRKRVKKQLDLNSGNYVGLAGGFIFHSIVETSDEEMLETSDSYFVGPVWGIQRNYLSGIHLGLSLGAGFGDGPHMDPGPVGIGRFEFGFAIR